MESIATELEDRAAQREKIEALFKSRPLQEIEPEELRLLTPHYQQRISESRRRGMRIENVKRYTAFTDDRRKRLDGAYIYKPFGESIGRDAGEEVPRRWNDYGAWQEQEFRLKP